MNNLIIGTAGHVDHGKTTLVEALTGINTDFLAEEKERGISIDLGFTHLALPSKRIAGIVDVPGHEKFIRNMMSGVGGIDVALLVIDSTVGIMPQTIEHLDIIRYMDIKHLIIVFTKCSLCKDDELKIAKSEIGQYLINTPYVDAPTVYVDSISRTGLDELINTIDNLAEKIDNSVNLNKPARLYIDRSFPKDGFGTVVTGSLLEGSISTNDELMLYPQCIKVKVRALQSYNHNVSNAVCKQRLAINLNGIKYKDVKRSDVVSSDLHFESTDIINAKIQLSSNRKVKNSEIIRFFFGNREITGKLFILKNTGNDFLVQIRLHESIYIRTYDHFVLRRLSPITTIGGGTVLQTKTKKMNKVDIYELNVLNAIYDHDLVSFIENYTKKFDILPTQLIYSTFNNFKKVPEGYSILGDILVTNIFLNKCKSNLTKVLDGYFSENSHEDRINLAKLKSLINIDNRVFAEIIKDFKIEKDSLVFNNCSKLNEFDTKIYKELIETVMNSSFSNFIKYDEIAKSQKHKSFLSKMYKDNVYVKLVENYIVSSSVFDEAKKILLDYICKNGKIDIKTYKDLLKIGRKNTVILLETFDSLRITKRDGNYRTIY